MKSLKLFFTAILLLVCLSVSLGFSAIPIGEDTIPSKTTTTSTTTRTTTTIPKTIDDVAKDISTLDTKINSLDIDISSLNKSIETIKNTGRISIHGTEYLTNQSAKVFLELMDSTYTPIDDASCFLNVYYPNNTIFLTNVSLTHKEDGLFYYDFITPTITGVYMTTARCIYNTTEGTYFASSFYYSNAQDITGDYTLTHALDYINHEYHTLSGSINATYNFTGITETNITSVVFNWAGKGTGGTTFSFYAYNFNTSTWVLLPVTTTGSGLTADAETITANNLINGGNATNYIRNGSASLRVFNSGTGKILQNDYIYFKAIGKKSYFINSMRGSGEIHVSENFFTNLNGINYTITQINITANDINSTANAINYTINNFNTTITANITMNITGNFQTAIDNLWIRIRNLLIALWTTTPIGFKT